MRNKICLNPENYRELTGEFDEGDFFEIFWGRMNIIIDDKDFFGEDSIIQEFKEEPINNDIHGLTLPMFPFIYNLFVNYKKIGVRDLILQEGPMGEGLVIKTNGDNIILAIEVYNGESGETKWYDGEKLISMNDLSKNDINSMPTSVFKQGLIEGMNNFFVNFFNHYPELRDNELINRYYNNFTKLKG
ncbi:hypothetical protein [Peribacillus loiseleuriae]|uniref:hypothetical protein n=1 Tax=Peribacillus loiseleuriae TaxID=1679170 RepID=UPI003CFC19D5